MKSTLLLLAFVVGAFCTASLKAQDAALKLNISERMTHRRAVEAVVWSMPLMNFKAMRDAQKKLGAGFNDIGYYSKVQTWRFQIATPNNTTPYIMSFWDLKDGPVVFELPASSKDVGIFGTLLDSWHRALQDVGQKVMTKVGAENIFCFPRDIRGDIRPATFHCTRKPIRGTQSCARSSPKAVRPT